MKLTRVEKSFYRTRLYNGEYAEIKLDSVALPSEKGSGIAWASKWVVSIYAGHTERGKQIPKNLGNYWTKREAVSEFIKYVEGVR